MKRLSDPRWWITFAGLDVLGDIIWNPTTTRAAVIIGLVSGFLACWVVDG